MIRESEVIRDLGVILSNDLSFERHILQTVEKMKSVSSWILRTFQSRECTLLLTLWKTLVIPIHDYCSQLWSPNMIKFKNMFEQLQYQFLKKIKNMRDKSYKDISKELKLYSLERRRDRYRIIYAWKIVEKLVPTTGIKENMSNRRGRLLLTQPFPAVQISGKISSFNKCIIRLWNALPMHIRNMNSVSVNKFKGTLDTFLQTIEDSPHL